MADLFLVLNTKPKGNDTPSPIKEENDERSVKMMSGFARLQNSSCLS